MALTELLKGQPKEFSWTAAAQIAFEAAKAALARATMLVFPDSGVELAVATDASDTHVGAVLKQRSQSGQWAPLAFYLAKLSPTQARYSTFDRELLAAFSALRHF